MSTRIIVGYFKNAKSYYTAIWEHIKNWKDAKRAIAVRFQRYEVPVYHRGHIVLVETKFRAIATFESKDGKIISRQCSSKNWPLYQVQETAPHTKYFRVIGLDGAKNSKPSDYLTCLEGCNCPAYRKNSGLIEGFCKHQLMIAQEIGLTEEEKDKYYSEGSIDFPFKDLEKEDFQSPVNFPNPPINWDSKNEDEVDLNKFSQASINFGAIKPKPPKIQKSPPGTLRVIEKGQLYGFFNISTGKFEEFNIYWEDITSKALFYQRRGHQIEGLFNNHYWIFHDGKWIEFKQWKREIQEAREMLGV